MPRFSCDAAIAHIVESAEAHGCTVLLARLGRGGMAPYRCDIVAEKDGTKVRNSMSGIIRDGRFEALTMMGGPLTDAEWQAMSGGDRSGSPNREPARGGG